MLRSHSVTLEAHRGCAAPVSLTQHTAMVRSTEGKNGAAEVCILFWHPLKENCHGKKCSPQAFQTDCCCIWWLILSRSADLEIARSWIIFFFPSLSLIFARGSARLLFLEISRVCCIALYSISLYSNVVCCLFVYLFPSTCLVTTNGSQPRK